MSEQYPSCTNCGRLVHGMGYWTGPHIYCSLLCRDTSAEMLGYEQTPQIVKRSPCFEGCLVCDGKGGANG